MVSYIGILCFISTAIDCIYVNSLALTGPDALGASEFLLLSLAYPGCHGLFQDTFNLMSWIHSAFTALDTGASVLTEVQHTGRVNAVQSVRCCIQGYKCSGV